MASPDDLGAPDDDWGPRGRDRRKARAPLRLGLLPIVVLAALVFALAFALAPWLTFRAVRSAAQNQDVQALGELIDYGAVRGGLRAQVRPTPAAQIPAPSVWEDPLGAMRHALQEPIARPPQVETYLTPAALARMTEGAPPVGPGLEPAASRLPRLIYWDPRRVRFGVENPGDPSQVTVFTFARTGPFDWTLVRIALPKHRQG